MVTFPTQVPLSINLFMVFQPKKKKINFFFFFVILSYRNNIFYKYKIMRLNFINTWCKIFSLHLTIKTCQYIYVYLYTYTLFFFFLRSLYLSLSLSLPNFILTNFTAPLEHSYWYGYNRKNVLNLHFKV